MASAIVLDTDIGTDVDDLIALVLALNSPEIELAAVTCVHADVELRARMVRKALRLLGRDDVPVGLGIQLPLLRARPEYWAGHEGVGSVDLDETLPALPHAVDLIIDLVTRRPGDVTLVPIGPLTNLAAAVIREPTIVAKARGVVMMGGTARLGNDPDMPWVEHNIRLDPEAAQVVFSAGWPIRMIGLDVTSQVTIRRDQMARILAGGTPLHHLIADQIVRYMRLRHRDWTYLHDPLAVATIVDPSLVRTERLRVNVEVRGELLAGATVARRVTDGTENVDVAVAVDAARFVDLLLSRLGQSS